MILSEKKLKELSYREVNRGDVDDILETAQALWKVARAARRWQRALPGVPSVNAEIEMIEKLDDLKEEPEAA
jgi:hypothetical protein